MQNPDEHDLGPIDLADGEWRAVTAGEKKVLLSRSGDNLFAVGAECPHAGGPLIEGARNGSRIVCPWHKAAFCLRTGAMLEPPALDPLPRYPVRSEAGRIFVATKPVEGPERLAVNDARTFVIVGGGAAGAVAAQTLREEGFDGAIIVLDRENRVPYDRTVLSKYHLSGNEGAEKTPLQSQRWYRAHRIDRRTADVTGIDMLARRVRCANGMTFSYDKALIATGAQPEPLKIPGHALANVFTLRSRADADAILAQAEQSKRATILGTSFIGMEVAAALRERGLNVTVIGKEDVPFEKQLGKDIGRVLLDLHESKGVAFRLGAEIAALEGNHAVSGVRLASGETIASDLVVAGFGVKPVTDFTESIALRKDGGIPVDETLRVNDDLYAAGDVAAFPYRDDTLRIEHWRVAQQHARIAARNMLGGDMRVNAPPVFWTIQYMNRLDYIGHAETWNDLIVHGDLRERRFLAYYVKDGCVSAATGMDRDADMAALVELFAMRDWSPEELGSDPQRMLFSVQAN